MKPGALDPRAMSRQLVAMELNRERKEADEALAWIADAVASIEAGHYYTAEAQLVEAGECRQRALNHQRAARKHAGLDLTAAEAADRAVARTIQEGG